MANVDSCRVWDNATAGYTEFAYSGNARTMLANALATGLSADGGVIEIGPSSATYKFPTVTFAVNKPNVRIECHPGAIFEADASPDPTYDALSTIINVQSGNDNFQWWGGQFIDTSDASLLALNATTRYLINVAGCDGVVISDVKFTFQNTSAIRVPAAGIRLQTDDLTPDDERCRDFMIDNCTFVADSSVRESVAYAADDVTPLGYVGISIKRMLGGTIRGGVYRGPKGLSGSGGGGLGIGRGFLYADDMMYSTLHGTRINEVDSEISADDEIAMVEITKTVAGTLEAAHNEISGLTFHDTGAQWQLLLRGGDFSSIQGCNFGRVSSSKAYTNGSGAIALKSYPGGVAAGGVDVKNNQFHNVRVVQVGDLPLLGAGVWVENQANFYITGNSHTLVNRGGSGKGNPRFPYVIGQVTNGRIGDWHLSYNDGAGTVNPFYPIYFIDPYYKTQVGIMRTDVQFTR